MITFDWLVERAGAYNDGKIDLMRFRARLHHFSLGAGEDDLELLAEAITLAWRQMEREDIP